MLVGKPQGRDHSVDPDEDRRILGFTEIRA
jgi:hypothetical protein